MARRRGVNGNDSPIDRLNDDELFIILSKLDSKSLYNAKIVCHRWQRIITIVLKLKSSVSFANHLEIRNSKISIEEKDRILKEDNIKMCGNCLEAEKLDRIVKDCPRLKNLGLKCYYLNTFMIRKMGSKFPMLESLNLEHCSGYEVRNRKFDDLFQGLKRLNLSKTIEFSDQCLAKLFRNLTSLEYLDLYNSDITGECLSELGPSLQYLYAYDCTNFTSRGLQSLCDSKCVYLQELYVNNFDIRPIDQTNEVFKRIIQKFSRLKSFGFYTDHVFRDVRLPLFRKSLSTIEGLKHLQCLEIVENCYLNDYVLIKIVKSCSRLEILRLQTPVNEITNDSILKLPMIPLLEELDITNLDKVSEDVLIQVIVQLPRLTYINLEGSNANDQFVVAAIKYCPRLSYLNIPNLEMFPTI